MGSKHNLISICFTLLVGRVSGGWMLTWMSKATAYATPLLSTSDVAADGYVCYHFWETAIAEKEKPVFFTISASLMAFSSLCSVLLFLYNNWDSQKPDSQKPSINYQQAPTEDTGHEYQELEPADDPNEVQRVNESTRWYSLWLQRWGLGTRISSLSEKCIGSEMPRLRSLTSAVLAILLLICLLPVGQILPIILWLQARQEQDHMPEEPIFPIATMPEKPRVSSLLSPEWQEYKRAYLKWVREEYYPYAVQANIYFEAQVKQKINTELPFVLETGTESTPQSLLQTSALVIYSQRDAAAITGMQFVSIGLSLLTIFSKAYILCESLFKQVFCFKMLCALSDVAALYYAVASLWSLRREDEGVIYVFFLTRPVDIFSAIYVYSLFAFCCAFSLKSVLFAFVEWRAGFHICNTNLSDGDWAPSYKLAVLNWLKSKWPGSDNWPVGEWVEERGHKEQQVFPPVAFMLTSFLVFQLAAVCVLMVVMLPVLLLVQACRSFWIALYIAHLEGGFSKPMTAGPALLVKIDPHEPAEERERQEEEIMSDDKEMPHDEGEEEWLQDCISEKRDVGPLRFASIPEGFTDHIYWRNAMDLTVSPCYDWSWQSNCTKRSEVHALPFVTKAKAGDKFATGAKLTQFLLDVHPPYRQSVEVSQSRTRQCYVQAYCFTREGSDHEARIRAVVHAIRIQYVAELQPAALPAFQVAADFCKLIKEIFGYVPTFLTNLKVAVPVPGAGLWETLTPFAPVNENISDSAMATIFTDRVTNFLLVLCVTWLAVYTLLFPSLSFGLASYNAVVGNLGKGDRCVAFSKVIHGHSLGETFSWTDAWHAVIALHSEECYETEGTPLNALRTCLFILQAVLSTVSLLSFPCLCWPFARFALKVPSYVIRSDADAFMQTVQAIYEAHYQKE